MWADEGGRRALGSATEEDNALPHEVDQRGSRIAAARDLADRAARGELDAGIQAYKARKAAQRAAPREAIVAGSFSPFSS